MKTVKEVSVLTGVSVRTLHHYDAISLLKPTRVTEAGYRLYDDEALGRLQTILLLRELRFPLKEIRQILDMPGFDPVAALADQIRLLELQREHLDRIIAHARQIQQAGVMELNFKPFDTTEQDQYAAEAKARWSRSDAYREFEQKSADQSGEQLQKSGDGLMTFFARMGQIRHLGPASPEAQELVSQIQAYITDHFYTCTRQILRGLGQMYSADDRFRSSIDAAGGEGTALFAARAIEIYTAE